MKIKILFLIVSFFIISCSDLVFVYEESQKKNILKNKSSWVILGDEISMLGVNLNKRLKKTGEPTYIIEILSKKKETNIVTEINQVASKINIQFKIKYVLSFDSDKCIIYEEEVITEASYNSKSEGYSFGTDLSKSEITKSIINENINIFLDNVETEIHEKAIKNMGCKG